MKTVCVYHSRDLDGWMSAAIVMKWFGQQEVPNKPGEDCNTLDFLGWDYGDDIPDLKDYGKVIMCDVSFPYEDMVGLMVCFKENFIWIDHHASAIKANNDTYGNPMNGLQDSKFAACELTWKYFFPEDNMPEIVRLLGRYDCFGHKGTDEEQKVLEFQYGARAMMSNYKDCYDYLTNAKILSTDTSNVSMIHLGGKYIYKYLCTEAEQTYSKAFPVDFVIDTTKIESDTINSQSTERKFTSEYKFLCVNQERFNPINFGIDYHKEGYDGFACFWFKDDKWSWSLYNDDGKVDCSVIAKQFGGGGHAGASGFVCDDIDEVLNSNKD